VRWAVAAVVVALAAVVAVNALLLAYGERRRDPVGRLSPVTSLIHAPVAHPRTPPAAQPPSTSEGGGRDGAASDD